MLLLDRRRWTETDDGRIQPKQVKAEGMEKATTREYLIDRIYDDDGEKWATVSIYRISSSKSVVSSHVD
jgi:hypothetical protein